MARVLVTGASSGIGAATARALRAAGDDVLELDVRPSADGIACDLADADAVRRAAETIAGPLDGIAHVAGVPGTLAPARVLAINFLGPRLLTDLLLPSLAGGASIVFVSSIASARCAWTAAELGALAAEIAWEAAAARLAARGVDGSQAYDLSKRLLAFALPEWTARAAERGVRVNLVSPGPVETPILDDFRATMGIDRIATAARVAGRHGRPEEVAAAIVFLLQRSATWINGIDLIVDGGLSTLRQAAVARESPV